MDAVFAFVGFGDKNYTLVVNLKSEREEGRVLLSCYCYWYC